MTMATADGLTLTVGDPWPGRLPYPEIPPYPYPPYVPTFPPQPVIKTITTTGKPFEFHFPADTARIAELEALLHMAHEALLSSDDDDALAVCELIEDTLDE
jgi:hypothetical protein